jgi:hypothetical protein
MPGIGAWVAGVTGASEILGNHQFVGDEMDAPVDSASQCARLIEQQTRFR